MPDTYGEGDVTRYDVRLSTHAWSPRETGIVAPSRSGVEADAGWAPIGLMSSFKVSFVLKWNWHEVKSSDNQNNDSLWFTILTSLQIYILNHLNPGLHNSSIWWLPPYPCKSQAEAMMKDHRMVEKVKFGCLRDLSPLFLSWHVHVTIWRLQEMYRNVIMNCNLYVFIIPTLQLSSICLSIKCHISSFIFKHWQYPYISARTFNFGNKLHVCMDIYVCYGNYATIYANVSVD